VAEIGVRERMLVKDVMSSPAITANEDTSINKVARLMEQYKIGCIIVTSKDGKPLGMITERDLVVRVLVKNAQTSKITAKMVMTSPLITIDLDETISEAARRMSQLDIRRFAIIYRGNLVGIISSKDILAVTPELIEIMQEKARIEGFVEEEIQRSPLAGYCDQCGRWSGTLKETEGSFLCKECQIEFEVEY
jgi:CBS domain-containing protein